MSMNSLFRKDVEEEVRARHALLKRMLPDGKRRGHKDEDLAQDWREKNERLLDAEDELLYQQVHVEGRPFHKALLALWLRKWSVTRKLLEGSEENK